MIKARNFWHLLVAQSTCTSLYKTQGFQYHLYSKDISVYQSTEGEFCAIFGSEQYMCRMDIIKEKEESPIMSS
jgi:hypothetical protein